MNLTTVYAFLKHGRRKIFYGLLIFFVVYQVVFQWRYWIYVAEHIARSDVGNMQVDAFACRNFIEPSSEEDQKFADAWRELQRVYGVDYYDIKYTIEGSCPILTDQEIENTWSYLLDGTDYYSDMNEKVEGEKRINVGKKSRDFRQKFLDRDFTILREDLKNE